MKENLDTVKPNEMESVDSDNGTNCGHEKHSVLKIILSPLPGTVSKFMDANINSEMMVEGLSMKLSPLIANTEGIDHLSKHKINDYENLSSTTETAVIDSENANPLTQTPATLIKNGKEVNSDFVNTSQEGNNRYRHSDSQSVPNMEGTESRSTEDKRDADICDDLSIHAKWHRRQKADFAFIKFRNPGDALVPLRCSNYIMIKGFSVPIFLSRDSERTLCLSCLDPSIEVDDIKMGVRAQFPKICVDRVYKPRKKVSDATEADVRDIRNKLVAAIENCIPLDRIDIDVKLPGKYDTYWKVKIGSRSLNDRDAILTSLKRLKIDDQQIEVQTNTKSNKGTNASDKRKKKQRDKKRGKIRQVE